MSKQVESAVTQSRGENVRNYHPMFSKNAQVMSGNIGALFLSGTIVSGKTTRAVLHGIGRKPKMVVVTPLLTLAQAISASNIDIALAAASAATSANFYVIGSQPAAAAIKYVAYVQF